MSAQSGDFSMNASTPLSPDSPLSDPVQAILGRLDLLLSGMQDLTPLLDLLNRPEGELVRQLMEILETLNETASGLEVAIRQLPDLLSESNARLTAMEVAISRHHKEQMAMLERLMRHFEAVE